MMQSGDGHVFRALTIAGSDSGGGAGIQADLKTMQQFQVYGMSVVTALTAQNTRGVHAIYDVSPAFVQAQLQAVFDDLGVDAVKTGMLATAGIVETVADFLQAAAVSNVLVDPVMVAKGGSSLLAQDAVAAMVRRLLPLAHVVTPNLPEAEVLCGRSLRTWSDCHDAAREIAALGPQVILLKGGHMPTDWACSPALTAILGGDVAVDLVYQSGQFTYFATQRLPSQHTHGTGCTVSAAITAMLAQGAPVLQAIASAKAFVFAAIAGARSWDVGSGHGPTDHSAPVPTLFEPIPGGFHAFVRDGWTVVPDGDANLRDRR